MADAAQRKMAGAGKCVYIDGERGYPERGRGEECSKNEKNQKLFRELLGQADQAGQADARVRSFLPPRDSPPIGSFSVHRPRLQVPRPPYPSMRRIARGGGGWVRHHPRLCVHGGLDCLDVLLHGQQPVGFLGVQDLDELPVHHGQA